jgi:ornithine carbamoyltransferase
MGAATPQGDAAEAPLEDLISLGDLSGAQIERIFARSAELLQPVGARRARGRQGRAPAAGAHPLEGQSVALIFEKPSLRTRVSFEVGITQLGGHPVYLSNADIQLGVRESVADVACNLERWVDMIVARTFAHDSVLELARHAEVPVINALTDFSHPCQGLADLYTLRQHRGPSLRGLTLAYVGDGNNVSHSLLYGCSALGIHLRVATPAAYAPAPAVVAAARAQGAASGAEVLLTSDPREAVAGADAVYTDVWTSMGFESERTQRMAIFRPYQVNAALMAGARPDALVMHCLPAHRGEEITDEVLDGPRSIVLDQAENRLHVQKGVMALLSEL